MKKVFYTIVCFCVVLSALSAQDFNRPRPNAIPPYEFQVNDNSSQSSFFTAPFEFTVNPEYAPSLQILDNQGFLVWYMQIPAFILLDFKYHPDHDQYSFSRINDNGDVYSFILNDNLVLTDSIQRSLNLLSDRHEFNIAPNGNYLLAGKKDSIMDLSAYQFNGVPGSENTVVRGFYIEEYDEDHHLIFSWDSNEHIHPTEAYEFYGYTPSGYKYAHGNSIEVDHDGNLLLSFRNLNAVYKIDRMSGEIIWRLGGKSSSFQFDNDPGFSGQHDARILANGNITVYDNAVMSPEPRVSRAVEYQLDTVNWIATKVWEHNFEPGFYADGMGNFHALEETRLINSGFVFRPDPTFYVVNNFDVVTHILNLKDEYFSYRSFAFDLDNFQERPDILCTLEGENIILNAPDGFQDYEWSTGSTSTAILVESPGTYQAWVNYGDGMIGSEPFVINELSDGCPITSIAPVAIDDSPDIIAIFNVLGQKIESPTQGQLYLFFYESGKSEFRIHR
ncbi:MAG: aryl-sulfate sulfotransferase [Bacteroidota bacterium]